MLIPLHLDTMKAPDNLKAGLAFNLWKQNYAAKGGNGFRLPKGTYSRRIKPRNVTAYGKGVIGPVEYRMNTLLFIAKYGSGGRL